MNENRLKVHFMNWYLEDLEWFKNSLIKFQNFETERVKKIYKEYIEWQIKDLKRTKEIIKNL